MARAARGFNAAQAYEPRAFGTLARKQAASA